MMRFRFTTYIERGDDELEVAVTYDASPFVAATYWQPAEGPEVELQSAVFSGDSVCLMPSPLTDAEEAKIIEECEARVASDFFERADEEADYRYEQVRDQQMTDDWERRA